MPAPQRPRGSLATPLATAIILTVVSAARATPFQPLIALSAGASAAQSWFSADAGFSGGLTASWTAAVDTSGVAHPAPAEVYQTERNGTSFGYAFSGLGASRPVTVRLHFAENVFTAAGQRVFNVTVTGTGSGSLTALDVWAQANAIYGVGQSKAIVKQLNAVTTAQGTLSIAFAGVVDKAECNGIEIIPGRSYAIDAGSASGIGEYAPDQFASGGTSSTIAAPIDSSLAVGPPPVGVLQSTRAGATIVYTLPGLIAGTPYDVRLFFVEPQFTLPGQRVFDVSLNGTRVLRSFDPFLAGGGRYKATVRQFTSTANPSGEIVVALNGVTGSAAISALTVAPRRTYRFNVAGAAAAPYDADQPGYFLPFLAPSPITTSHAIAGGSAPTTVYQSAQQAVAMQYTLPDLVPGQLYALTLHFAEINPAYFGDELRRFDIQLNGNLVAKDVDVYKSAPGPYVAWDWSSTYAAGPDGRLTIALAPTGAGVPMLSGLSVEPAPTAAGYTVQDIGEVGHLPGVLGRDGGVSGFVDGKMVWFFGDTGLAQDTDAGTTPPHVNWWTNTAGTSDVRRPWNLSELTDGSSTVPLGQLVPFSQAELDYNNAHFYQNTCGTECNHTYYAVWPGSIIGLADGTGVVFAGDALIDVNEVPIANPPADVGVVTMRLPIGFATANPAPQAHAVLFPPTDRQFSNAIVQGSYVYNYNWELGTYGFLAVALTKNVATTALHLRTPLNGAVMQGQKIQIGSGNVQQSVVVSTDTPAKALVIPVNSFKPLTDYPAGDPGADPPAPFTEVRHDGTWLSTLKAAVPSGQSTTTLSIAALPVSLTAGTGVWLDANTRTQRVVLATAAAAGDTTLVVQPFIPSGNYGTATVIETDGCGFFCVQHFVARAPVAQATTRSAWRFWNQAANPPAWVSNIAKGTPMLNENASADWLAGPSVAWNAHFDKYVSVTGYVINGSLMLSTADAPQGPWSPAIEITRLNATNAGLGNYFVVQHPEMQLGNGQAFYVTYFNDTGGIRVLQVIAPDAP